MNKIDQLTKLYSPSVITDKNALPWELKKWEQAGKPYIWCPEQATNKELDLEVWSDIGYGKMALFQKGKLIMTTSSDFMISPDGQIVVLGPSYGFVPAEIFIRQQPNTEI